MIRPTKKMSVLAATVMTTMLMGGCGQAAAKPTTAATTRSALKIDGT